MDVADGERVSRPGMANGDALLASGEQQVGVDRRGIRAPRLEEEADREPGEHGREPHDVIGVGMGSDRHVEPLHPERRQLGRHLLGIGATVDQDARASGGGHERGVALADG